MTTTARKQSGWRTAVVMAWVVAGVAQVLFAMGACVTPELPWLLAEVAAFTGVGIAIARFIRPTWHSSLITPGALLIVSAVWRSEHSPVGRHTQLFVIPLLVVVAMRVFHDLTNRLPAPSSPSCSRCFAPA